MGELANYSKPKEAEEEVVAAIEEIVAEFGLRTVIAAALKTEVGDKLQATNPQVTQRVIQFLLREIVFNSNPQLQAEIMAVGAGILDDNGIITRIAKRHGITRQAVSKRVVAFCDEWKLQPSVTMKSAAARKKYAMTNQPRASL